MIFTFTGNGKGKTSASIGMGIRAVGSGKKVIMIQFLKPGNSSENKTIKKINNFDIYNFGIKRFYLKSYKNRKKIKKFPSLEEIKLSENGFDFAREVVNLKQCDFLILDEINIVLHYGLLDTKKFLNFLKKNKRKLNIVITGRKCPKEIIEISDLVTECEEIKHYFSKVKKPIRGIDY